MNVSVLCRYILTHHNAQCRYILTLSGRDQERGNTNDEEHQLARGRHDGRDQDGKGNSLFYGAFGSGTYGLTTTVDGREVELCVRAEIGENVYGKADELLAKLAGGWRPRNW